MALVGAMTLWGLAAAFFLFPLVNVPPILRSSVGTLMSAELLALLVHSWGSENCEPGSCSELTAVAGAMASQDVPVLTVVLFGLAVGYGLRASAHQT